MKRFAFLLLAWLAATAWGAPPVKPAERDPSAPIRLLFKPDQPFSATALITVTPPEVRQTHTIDIAYAWRDGKFRAELEPPKVTKDGKRSEAADAAFGRALNRVVYITDPAQPVIWLVYPVLKGYMEKTDSLAGFRKTPRIEKTNLDRDTINGHPCERCKVVVTAASGDSRVFTVWEAADLNGLPIQALFTSDDNTIKVTLTNISTNAPDAALFRLPENAKFYESQDELMTGYVIQMIREMKGISVPTPPPAAPPEK